MDERSRKRHIFFYRFLRALVRRPITKIMRYTAERIELPDTPCLVLSNHNTDLDPILIGLAFDRQMYFVASEHVFRKGLWSRLLTYFFAPISRLKGSTDAMAALEIIRNLRAGKNVCLFAEGNRSYTGVTGAVFPATGKLAKASGATLVTFRFIGGYLATPRWGRHPRRGPMRGELVGIYSPETLKAMRPEEINAVIARDIHEDAFERQAAEHAQYPGKALAEWLETALYICPKCGRIGTLKSSGDTFFCTDCGFAVTYTEEGFFAGADVPFMTVRDWDAWQSDQMALIADSLGDGEAFSDDGATLEKIEADHQSTVTGTGRLSMSKTALEIGSFRLKMEEISGMGIFGKAKIALTASDGAHYEIRFPPARCARKYLKLYQLIRG